MRVGTLAADANPPCDRGSGNCGLAPRGRAQERLPLQRPPQPASGLQQMNPDGRALPPPKRTPVLVSNLSSAVTSEDERLTLRLGCATRKRMASVRLARGPSF